MRLLYEPELATVQFFLEHVGETIEMKYADIEFSHFNVFWAHSFLFELEESGCIEIQKTWIEFGSFFYDAFLARYASLVNSEKIDEAKELAEAFGVPSLNKALKKQNSLQKTLDIINETLSEKNMPANEGRFPEDLFDAIKFRIKVNKSIKGYFDAYLKEFQENKLEKKDVPEIARIIPAIKPPTSYKARNLLRYEKQAGLFLDAILESLEEKPPQEVVVDQDKLPLRQMNREELLLCLKREGLFRGDYYRYVRQKDRGIQSETERFNHPNGRA